jgi:enoyl-CoA hydratase/carnithine racemase
VSAVRLDTSDGVAVVTVDNPPVNALGDAVLEELGDAGAALAADREVRAVVLTGAGDKAFMAGADLAEFQRLLDGEGSIEEHVARSRRALDLLASLPQPVVAAVQAAAMGGGLEVALTCDLIVADPAARLGLPEVRLGLMPGAGGTQRLPRRVGAGPAAELLLLGKAVDAAEAHRLGLVNRVSAPGAALAESLELASRLASLSARAVQSIKQVLAVDDGAGLDRERAAFLALFHSDDAREGVAAFVEKRMPSFTHS